jgi:hypothetical protein
LVIKIGPSSILTSYTVLNYHYLVAAFVRGLAGDHSKALFPLTLQFTKDSIPKLNDGNNVTSKQGIGSCPAQAQMPLDSLSPGIYGQ